MSAASFSSSNSLRSRTGFDQREVSNFLARGASLTTKRSTDGKSIGSFKPITRLLSEERITNSKAGSLATLFGAKDRGIQTTETIFGIESKITSEQLDSLTNTFLQRQRSIQQRRAQPGRSALFLARS